MLPGIFQVHYLSVLVNQEIITESGIFMDSGITVSMTVFFFFFT